MTIRKQMDITDGFIENIFPYGDVVVDESPCVGLQRRGAKLSPFGVKNGRGSVQADLNPTYRLLSIYIKVNKYICML